MSFAFRKHDFDLNTFDRCPEHGCVMMQVDRNVKPVCLVEWLTANSWGYRVRDVILREEGEYDLPALILENGFLVPVHSAIDGTSARPGEIAEGVIGGLISDVLYVRGDRGEAVALELTLEPAENTLILRLDMQILLYLLYDEEIRKVEP